MDKKVLETSPINVKLSLVVDGGSPYGIERTLQLENIPGAWRIHAAETELPGVGQDRASAIFDFIGKNYSGKRLKLEEVCESVVTTFLKRADHSQMRAAAEALFKIMLPPQ